MPSIRLTSRHTVTRSSPVFVIAEIGQNHQGDLELAKRMALKATECGADCVKFQKSSLEDKFTGDALAAPYAGANSWGATYGEHKCHLEFSAAQYAELKSFCDEHGVFMTASAMDIPSADFLINDLGVPFIKVGSGDSTNPLLFQHLAKHHRGVSDIKH